MSGLRLLLVHTYFETLELARQPMYILTTIVFPSMFFWFFGVPNAQDEPSAKLLTGSFASFGVLGVVVFQFGVSVAQERKTPWASYLRLLPMPDWIPIASKLSAGVIFSIPTIAGVLLIARWNTPFHPSLELVLRLYGALLLSGLPFGLLGLLIGLTCTAKSALPVANMVYLPLSFAGGLWLPPNALPKIVQDISVHLPTRHLGEIAWAVTLEKAVPQTSIQYLAAYFIVFWGSVLWARRQNF